MRKFLHKNLFGVLVIIILFALSITFIYIGVSHKTNLNPNLYSFSVLLMQESGENINGNISDLFLQYSFKEEKGFFTFKIYSDKSKNLFLKLPEIFEISNLEISGFKEGEYYPICQYSFFFGAKNEIMCPPIPGNRTLKFVINLTSYDKLSFSPNGIYSFSTSFNETSIKYFKDTYSKDLLRLNFGNKYRCSEHCFAYELGEANLMYNANKDSFRVYNLPKEVNEKEGWGKVGKFTRFSINTYNFDVERKAEIFLSIGISILVGLLVLAGDFLLRKNK